MTSGFPVSQTIALSIIDMDNIFVCTRFVNRNFQNTLFFCKRSVYSANSSIRQDRQYGQDAPRGGPDPVCQNGHRQQSVYRSGGAD